ncbi:MAG: leucine-rich repeat domain-containing protein [Oscillospiraceae bacterium]|nr:leucine-rich repeat domain-containing protein [Oscillospiraceae bacterium]
MNSHKATLLKSVLLVMAMILLLSAGRTSPAFADNAATPSDIAPTENSIEVGDAYNIRNIGANFDFVISTTADTAANGYQFGIVFGEGQDPANWQGRAVFGPPRTNIMNAQTATGGNFGNFLPGMDVYYQAALFSSQSMNILARGSEIRHLVTPDTTDGLQELFKDNLTAGVASQNLQGVVVYFFTAPADGKYVVEGNNWTNLRIRGAENLGSNPGQNSYRFGIYLEEGKKLYISAYYGSNLSDCNILVTDGQTMLPDNIQGQTVSIGDGEVMSNNYGTINEIAVSGQLATNSDLVVRNYGVIETNGEYGSIIGNNGLVKRNYGQIETNYFRADPENGFGEAIGVTRNYGTIANNSGIIYSNEAGGTITENNVLDTNRGTVVNNNENIFTNEQGGVVSTNKTRIGVNRGTVYEITVTGQIATNSDLVVSNYGVIEANDENGSITENNGLVKRNYGQIETNYFRADPENGFGEAIGVTRNYGTIANNNGIIYSNESSGTITENNVLDTNRGIVVNNNENIFTNQQGGTVMTNKARIGSNYGTVSENTTTGTVLNREGGLVTTNNGFVFNYGGTVTSNIGTEYYQVSIVNSDLTNTTTATAGLTEDSGLLWLGVTGSNPAVATVTIIPAEGYSISAIPNLQENVDATENPDGTWTLTVTGGRYTEIVVPRAFGTPDFVLPADVKTIGDSAFEGAAMSIVSIPEGCETIGAAAFKDCHQLRQIRIPDSVRSIDESAFANCSDVAVFGSGAVARQIAELYQEYSFVYVDESGN